MNLLLIDSNYMARRAFNSVGKLKGADIKTGTIFGFLRDIDQLQKRFPAHLFVFFWDGGYANRKKIYPAYKQAREDRRLTQTKDEKLEYDNYKIQIDQLRDEILPALGFNNIIRDQNFEGDDLIAQAVVDTNPKDTVIVSADQDFYQLLFDDVRVYHPAQSKTVTNASFCAEYGISPLYDWVRVKAIAGCKSDGIAGLKGVGEKTAAKWLAGNLNPETKTAANIEKFITTCAYKTNIKLVSLPFADCKVPPFVANSLSDDKWNAQCTEFKITILLRGRSYERKRKKYGKRKSPGRSI